MTIFDTKFLAMNHAPMTISKSAVTVHDADSSDSSIDGRHPRSTDTSSASSDGSKGPQSTEDLGRVVRTRRSLVTSYNENILSSTAYRRKSNDVGQRNISGKTLVEGVTGEDLLDRSIKALDMDWTVDTQSLGGSNKAARESGLKRRSTRLDFVGKMKDGVTGTLSTLGKRTREAMESSKENVQNAAQELKRRTSTRVVPAPTKATGDEPPKKKTRLSSDSRREKESESPAPAPQPKPKTKRWLARGLYTGQHRHFDPRLTEAKNKRKAALKTAPEQKQTTMLPLPMFLGERLLGVGRDFRLPFDVFNPLPPGQPKPDEWRKTQRNVFIGDAAAFWKEKKREEVSRCVCTRASGCDDNCFNRFMFYECDEKNCTLGPEYCTNRSFEGLRQRCKLGGKFNVGVEVMKTDGKGYGVRSNRTFEPHQIIVEYTGEIITQEECEERMKTRYKDNESYYLMSFDQNMIIDATRGSIARFVNHSCAPNCKMVKWTVAGKPRMALFAGENGIMTGDELTYDYNFDPFSIKNVQECRCGADDCRGVLGPRPKEPKTVLTNIIGQVRNAKRKIQDVVIGDDLAQKGIKKRKVAVPTSAKSTKSRAFKSSLSQTERKLSGSKKPTKRSPTSSHASPLKRTDTRITISRMKSVLKAKSKNTLSKNSPAPRRKSMNGSKAAIVKTAAASVRRGVERSVRGARRSQAMPGTGPLGSKNQSESTIRVISAVE